jgi:hypothetical protein
MIIFGWGGGTPKDRGAALPLVCGHCGRQGFFHHMSVTKWFRLYFIPVFPYSVKHYLICPTCTRGSRLTALQRRRTAELVELTKLYRTGTLPEPRYLELVAGGVDAPVRGGLPAAATPPAPASTAGGARTGTLPPRPDGWSGAADAGERIRSGDSWAG